MDATIVDVETVDLRFPTSRELDGSDAMNEAPDYSAAYVVLHTDGEDALAGHGFTFTIGRGNELAVEAAAAIGRRARGWSVAELVADPGGFSRHLQADSQLRWLGPAKGTIQLGLAAVVNAAWDLIGKATGKPVWKVLADMTPQQLVDLVDWRYLRDTLTPETALELLEKQVPGRAEREVRLREEGYPAYTTSAGWLGYDDAKLVRLCREAVAAGWESIKLKVGADLDADVRRCGLAREVAHDRRQPDPRDRRGDPVDGGARALRHLVVRGTDQSRRRARARSDRPCHRADACRDRRARAQRGDVQAVPGRGGDGRLPARRRPARRRRRGRGRAAARRRP
jgi:L-fuconate dehydratase